MSRVSGNGRTSKGRTTHLVPRSGFSCTAQTKPDAGSSGHATQIVFAVPQSVERRPQRGWRWPNACLQTSGTPWSQRLVRRRPIEGPLAIDLREHLREETQRARRHTPTRPRSGRRDDLRLGDRSQWRDRRRAAGPSDLLRETDLGEQSRRSLNRQDGHPCETRGVRVGAGDGGGAVTFNVTCAVLLSLTAESSATGSGSAPC